MNSSRRFELRLATGLLLAMLPACQSIDPAFLTSEGRLVSDVDPIPFRVAVAPLKIDNAIDLQKMDDSGLRFTFDRGQLQARLIEDLRAVRTATEVFAVGESALEDAKAARADLLLRPRLTAVRIAPEGTSTDQLLSSFLWLTTWVGGMFVSDSTYDARLEIEWDIVNPFDNRNIDNVLASSQQVDLSWWKRNDLISIPLVQTLILPPFLTTDDDETTSRSLSEIASARVAARLAGYLKSGFGREAREVVGELRVDSPRNGAVVDGTARLRGKIVARGPITAINIYVNEQPVVVLSGEDIAPAVEQTRGSTFQLPISQQLDLREGKNQIAIEFAVRGNYTSRTLIVHYSGNNVTARGAEVSQK